MTHSRSSEAEHTSDSDLLSKLDPDLLPKHLAVIMDGNGRWAEQQGLPRIAGHQEGIKSVRDLISLSLELGIKVLTIYAFSQENWKRPAPEIRALMGLLEHYLSTERSSLVEQGVRFEPSDGWTLFPHPPCAGYERQNKRRPGLKKMTLAVALSYGGRAELVDAARHLARRVKDGSLEPDRIDETLIQQALYTHDLPDPDLLIRTSGETRISNFLLWQLAYTELYFTPTLWPDFRRREALVALLEYQRRERRFGRVLSTVSS